MFIQFGRFRCLEDIFGLGNFGGSSVGHEKILVHLDGGFVSQDTVLGYANAVEGSSQ